MNVGNVLNDSGNIAWEMSVQSSAISNVFNRIDVPKLLCEQCHEEKKLSLCARCKKVSYCGKECQLAAWKTHEMFCRNHSLIPKDDEIVCKFKEGNEVRDMTQREFKERLGSTFIRAPLFSKEALKHANTSFDSVAKPPIHVTDSLALYDQGYPIGHGLVALRDIRRMETICDFGGIAIPEKDWYKKSHSLRAQLYSSKGRDFVFDPSIFSSLGAFANDGFPNAELITWGDAKVYSDKVQVPLSKVVIANKDIKAGETIRVDYGWLHAMKMGPYVLDKNGKRDLLEKFSERFDVSLLNETGWLDSSLNPKTSDPSNLVRATEIEYILTTTYVLAFLHLSTHLDPNETLKGIENLPIKIREDFKEELESASSVLKGISKIHSSDKPKFLEIASKISQDTLIWLCGFLSEQSSQPSIDHCEILGKAIDRIRLLCCGSLIGMHWQSEEQEEFKKTFLSAEHQRSIYDETDIQALPFEFKNNYYSSRERYTNLVTTLSRTS